MSPSTPDAQIADDHLVIEAPTAEAALELVAEQLGTHARIAGVERVRRGGLAGFFTRELVQVRATIGADGADGAVAQPAADGKRAPIDAVLDRMDDEEPTFDTLLGRRLTRDDPAPPTAPAPPAPPPAAPPPPPPAPVAPVADRPVPPTSPPRVDRPPAADAPRGLSQPPSPGTPQWNLTNLRRLGLSALLGDDDARDLADGDDIGWTHAVAARLAPLCGPLPDGPTIVAGPRAARLADVLQLDVCEPYVMSTRYSFIAAIGDGDEERSWLRATRGQRRLHVVVGDNHWRGLLFEGPDVLSWTAGGLCAAVALAAELGLVLGFGVPYAGPPVRANPVDVAVAIRGLLPVTPVAGGRLG